MQELDYNYKVVKQFAIMTVVWGIVGMLVGVVIAGVFAAVGVGLLAAAVHGALM